MANVFTNYKKDVHPNGKGANGAIEVYINLRPLFLEIVSGFEEGPPGTILIRWLGPSNYTPYKWATINTHT